MKSLNDIKQDMSALYDEVRNGTTELKTASELANITGKFLKAHQLDLAERIFASDKPVLIKTIQAHEQQAIGAH